MDAIIDADITDADIRALRIEAGAAGDQEMVALCNLALQDITSERHAAAKRECLKAIRDARRNYQENYHGA